ncbi:hypothetical protein CGLO_08795 [Colletotrichum gloeosporioides Cg-14]|uniref:Uncharacterized protein n=1 Tax=Colletotrichum gloeosporioides (strain Cg-14) TaxID=1237896 RepID=T0LTQ9_COLGC|nr:hypothetical protein CGLO_08795 [Colletotrichum gloeosporioides Cg-14]
MDRCFFRALNRFF